MKFSENQKKLLDILLKQYENSKTYQGENLVTQSFSTVPKKIFQDYESDFADMDQVRDFEAQMRELESRGLIFIQWSKQRQGSVIKKLTANPEAWPEYYRILNRQEKREIVRQEMELYESYMGTDPILDRFCQEQTDRIASGKKASYSLEEAKILLSLARFVLKNQDDLLERELSIAVLHDSKKWEQTWRSRVCRLLKQYGNFDDLLAGVSEGTDTEDRRETEKIILAEYHIYSNASYVYFKGNAEVIFDSGQKLLLDTDLPMAFSTETLRRLSSLRILENTVMTVENLTSFNRMREEHAFLIFLSGYHNTAKQQLIRRIADANPGLKWQHFGDIDPDGFYIIEHLQRGTGIQFQPVYMDVQTLEKYREYTKRLTKNDVRKAETLAESGKYADVMKYMLVHDVKLEQEIVSWGGGEVPGMDATDFQRVRNLRI